MSAGRWTGSSEPVKRSAPRVGDGQDEHAIGVKLERNEIRELFEKRLSNCNWSAFCTGPGWMHSSDSFEAAGNLIDAFDEPVA